MPELIALRHGGGHHPLYPSAPSREGAPQRGGLIAPAFPRLVFPSFFPLRWLRILRFQDFRQRRGLHALVLRQRRGTHALVLRPRRGRHALVLRPRRGTHALVLRQRRGLHALVLRQRRGTHALVLRPRRGRVLNSRSIFQDPRNIICAVTPQHCQ